METSVIIRADAYDKDNDRYDPLLQADITVDESVAKNELRQYLNQFVAEIKRKIAEEKSKTANEQHYDWVKLKIEPYDVDLACKTDACVYNHNGYCRYAAVFNAAPNITKDEGCTVGIIKEST